MSGSFPFHFLENNAEYKLSARESHYHIGKTTNKKIPGDPQIVKNNPWQALFFVLNAMYLEPNAAVTGVERVKIPHLFSTSTRLFR